MTVARFFRTPKGVQVIVLLVLLALAGFGEPAALVAQEVAVAVVTAMALDLVILRVRKRKWVFPDGALLTGLFVAMILSPREPWYVIALTSGVGVASKYMFRARTANVFNPAAVALVATFYPFGTAQSWWGALGDLPPLALLVLVGTGVFVAHRTNKFPVALAFLGTYYLLFTLTAFVGDAARVAELYRAPDLHAALFFAFFMVTDPPTSPPRPRDQLVYGAITAAVSYAAFETIGAAWFLLGGLLVANGWEAVRRSRYKERRVEGKKAS